MLNWCYLLKTAHSVAHNKATARKTLTPDIVCSLCVLQCNVLAFATAETNKHTLAFDFEYAVIPFMREDCNHPTVIECYMVRLRAFALRSVAKMLLFFLRSSVLAATFALCLFSISMPCVCELLPFFCQNHLQYFHFTALI